MALLRGLGELCALSIITALKTENVEKDNIVIKTKSKKKKKEKQLKLQRF